MPNWTFEEERSSLGNKLELDAYRGQISVSVENPWAGDTESGFGYTTSVDLSPAQARQLAESLLAAADLAEAPQPEPA